MNSLLIHASFDGLVVVQLHLKQKNSWAMIICVGCESYGVRTVWLNVQHLISTHTYICIHLKILTRYELAHLQMDIGLLLSEIFLRMLLVGHLTMMMQSLKGKNVTTFVFTCFLSTSKQMFACVFILSKIIHMQVV